MTEYQSLLKTIIEKTEEGSQCQNYQYEELQENHIEEELQEEELELQDEVETLNELESCEKKLSFFEYQHKYLIICGGITTLLGALMSYYLYRRNYKNNK